MGVRTRVASPVSRQEGSTQVVREKVKLGRRGIPSTSVPTPDTIFDSDPESLAPWGTWDFVLIAPLLHRELFVMLTLIVLTQSQSLVRTSRIILCGQFIVIFHTRILQLKFFVRTAISMFLFYRECIVIHSLGSQ